MSIIAFKPQSIKLSITAKNGDQISKQDTLSLYGGLDQGNPSDNFIDDLLLEGLKPSFLKEVIIDSDLEDPSVIEDPSLQRSTILTKFYRTWVIYYSVKDEGDYFFTYRIFDACKNPGTIEFLNPSQNLFIIVCLTPNKATTPVLSGDGYLANPSGVSELTLSF